MPRASWALIVGFAGVAMLAWDKATFKPDASGVAPGWAVLACLLACVCYGISASYTKRYLTGMPPLVTAAGSQIGATLGLALPAAWLWPAQMPGAHAWLALLAVGVVCTGVAYILFFRLIENAGPPRALSVTFLVPVFAVLYGVLFLGEHVTAWMVICAVVIVMRHGAVDRAAQAGPQKRLNATMTSARKTKLKIKLAAPKPRNPLVAPAAQRKAGSHRKIRSQPAQERKDGAEETAVPAVIRASPVAG
jgi:uncharacterized membrane protein